MKSVRWLFIWTWYFKIMIETDGKKNCIPDFRVFTEGAIRK
jgi:hypothetical protein